MERHGSETYFVIGEGLLGESVGGRVTLAPAEAAGVPPFRFSRMGPNGAQRQLSDANRTKIADAMAVGGGGALQIPAGFTYLGQFVDHDLTFDKTNAMLGQNVSPTDLLQARSPSLDLDSLYGAGPTDPGSTKFYEADGLHVKMGKTAAVGGITAKEGFDLPRGPGTTTAEKRKATLPAGGTTAQRFAPARELVTKHYQWMLRTDFLPRVCLTGVVNDVFTNGRKAFEVGATPTDVPTMPIEFSVAAYRLGHSMVRSAYNWNKVFDDGA